MTGHVKARYRSRMTLHRWEHDGSPAGRGGGGERRFFFSKKLIMSFDSKADTSPKWRNKNTGLCSKQRVGGHYILLLFVPLTRWLLYCCPSWCEPASVFVEAQWVSPRGRLPKRRKAFYESHTGAHGSFTQPSTFRKQIITGCIMRCSVTSESIVTAENCWMRYRSICSMIILYDLFNDR